MSICRKLEHTSTNKLTLGATLTTKTGRSTVYAYLIITNDTENNASENN